MRVSALQLSPPPVLTGFRTRPLRADGGPWNPVLSRFREDLVQDKPASGR